MHIKPLGAQIDVETQRAEGIDTYYVKPVKDHSEWLTWQLLVGFLHSVAALILPPPEVFKLELEPSEIVVPHLGQLHGQLPCHGSQSAMPCHEGLEHSPLVSFPGPCSQLSPR